MALIFATRVELEKLVVSTIISAIIVTGGIGFEDDATISAKVILPDARSCSMPDLPSKRNGHTQSGSENLTDS